MAKIIALSILCFFGITGIALAQTAKKVESDYFQARINGKAKTLFDKHLYSGETNTITFSVSNYTMGSIKGFKKELESYYEKIAHIDFDENTYMFTITYTAHMEKADLISTFDKYGINYFVKSTPTINQNQ